MIEKATIFATFSILKWTGIGLPSMAVVHVIHRMLYTHFIYNVFALHRLVTAGYMMRAALHLRWSLALRSPKCSGAPDVTLEPPFRLRHFYSSAVSLSLSLLKSSIASEYDLLGRFHWRLVALTKAMQELQPDSGSGRLAILRSRAWTKQVELWPQQEHIRLNLFKSC